MAKKRKTVTQKKKSSPKEIRDYDQFETGEMIDPSKPLSFEDIGIQVPDSPPTQVVSIRIPRDLLNELKALGSQRDVPYQALIKLYLDEAVKREKKKSA